MAGTIRQMRDFAGWPVVAQSWRYPVAVRLSAQLVANVERVYRARRVGGIALLHFDRHAPDIVEKLKRRDERRSGGPTPNVVSHRNETKT